MAVKISHRSRYQWGKIVALAALNWKNSGVLPEKFALGSNVEFAKK